MNRCWRTGRSQARNPPPSSLAPPPVAPEVNKVTEGKGGRQGRGMMGSNGSELSQFTQWYGEVFFMRMIC